MEIILPKKQPLQLVLSGDEANLLGLLLGNINKGHVYEIISGEDLEQDYREATAEDIKELAGDIYDSFREAGYTS